MKPDWKLHHVGVVVRDLEKSMAYYEQLGVVEKVSALMTAEGKKAKLLGRFIRVGSMNLELWQPIRGATVQQEFLDTQGEGINHLAYTVDDYEKEYRDFVERQGIRLIFGSKPPISGERAGGYFDTRKAGHNIIFELMSRSYDDEVPVWMH
jgi:methylmalonyl-CoA/ethylmalonyl-CoA epimerase